MWPTLLELLETLGYIFMTVQTSQRMTLFTFLPVEDRNVKHPSELRMRCTSEISSEEAIITVPSKRALQVTTGGPNPDWCSAEAWQNLSWWAQLALLLVKEAPKKATCHCDHCLVFWADSSWRPKESIVRRIGCCTYMSVSWLYILFYRLFASVCHTVHPFRKALVASVGAGKAVRFTIGRVDWEFAKRLCRDLHEVGFT